MSTVILDTRIDGVDVSVLRFAGEDDTLRFMFQVGDKAVTMRLSTLLELKSLEQYGYAQVLMDAISQLEAL